MSEGAEHAPFLFAMKQIAFSIFLSTILLASLALPQSSVPAASKKTTNKAAAPKGSAKTSTKKGKAGKRAPVVARQMAPTPDRYRDIQQSLVAKGYLKSEPNGVWDTQSADALRQFQTDQKLTPTGKISSATLIALGLGPKTPEAASPPASQ
jgi:peptidoglycan hydrolase-like protein with peptidoglycan-binding domain